MVSLSRTQNTNAGGATFFNEPNMDDAEYLQPILESYGIFKPLSTIPLFGVHTLATLALEIAAVVFTVVHRDDTKRCREYFILIYLQIALWFFTLVVDQVARARHYRLRMNGYLEFYKKTQLHHRLPFYVVSLWTTTVALVQSLMQQFYPNDFADKCVKDGLLSPIGYQLALFTAQFCVVFAVNVNYILRVRKFNRQRPPPDVQKEEWNACASSDSFAQGEIGYRQYGDKMLNFIEKQADLIRHLKDHNAKLGEKLMVLNAQMQNRTRATNA